MDKFDLIIKKYYKEIHSSNNSINIKVKINECKNYLNMEQELYFSDFYNEIVKKQKEKGAVYTPRNIVRYMIKNSIDKDMIIKNPFIKILDPSCGGGNFIIELYKHLFQIYCDNLEMINKINNLNLNKGMVHKHILGKNIYGFDIDKKAIQILRLDLWDLIGDNDFSDNIRNSDFLMIDEKEKFNVILGNPPYIGHKSIDKSYIKNIKEFYSDVYKNKSDLCYCFIKKAKKICTEEGIVIFIISRYFLEGQNAISIRNFIKNNYEIETIIDYYGLRPFKGNGIDPAILFLKNSPHLKKEYDFQVIRPFLNQIREKKFDFISEVHTKKNIHIIKCRFSDLEHENWVILDQIEKNIVNKIIKRSNCKLGNLVESFQGVITGCDKAFIVNEEIINNHKIERDLIHSWIKSSNIDKNRINKSNLKLIYSNDISEEIHKNALKYIEPFKEKLNNRRECIKGIRKWYELQWGRDKENFKKKKIVHPYKSNENRFAIDDGGSYFSADVYGFRIAKDILPYEDLTKILNSKVYEFYIKTVLKKLGDYLYEYYPNNLLKIGILSDMNRFLSGNFTDEELYDFYNLTSKEIEFINQSVKNNKNT